MANIPLKEIKKQQILELYLCGSDKRLQSIDDCVRCNASTVSTVIQLYFDKKLIFERGEDFIYHSSMNNY